MLRSLHSLVCCAARAFLAVVAALGAAQVGQAQYLDWARVDSGGAATNQVAMAGTPDGGAVVAGRIVGSGALGLGDSTQATVAVSTFRLFLAEYNAAGALVWAHIEPARCNGNVTSVVVGHEGQIYVGGEYFLEGLVFDQGGAAETTLPWTIGRPGFIAKFAAGGTLNFQFDRQALIAHLRAAVAAGRIASGSVADLVVRLRSNSDGALRELGRSGVRVRGE